LRTEGWIEKLNVKSNGERVKKGDVLFELYSRDLVNAQEEYVQALRGSNDYLKRASRERLEALGMSTQQIGEVAKKRRTFQQVRVLASQDGIVHNLKVREGMHVKPSMEIMTLADLSTVLTLASQQRFGLGIYRAGNGTAMLNLSIRLSTRKRAHCKRA
jgi:Cu(I)/Ag(I) efflux system membrane fusion protein